MLTSEVPANPVAINLSQYSKKDRVWGVKRNEADSGQAMFIESKDPKQVKRGERMTKCGGYLLYKVFESKGSEGDKELVHKLRYAEFCHVRLCSICQWRKALSWQARFYKAWPSIRKAYPTARYIHLVLTIPNCSIGELREHLKRMSKAWNRVTSRKTWPALGFLRSVEVTRGRDGNAHPHYHVLLMVPAGYFSTKQNMYMNVEQWRDYWAKALRVPSGSLYPPFAAVCRKNMRKGKGAGVKTVGKGVDDIADAVCEVVKYAVKGQDMVKLAKTPEGRDWFRELDTQLSGSKAVLMGGVIKEFVNSGDITDEEMLHREEEEMKQAFKDWRYDWFPDKKSYLRTKILDEMETAFWDRQEAKRKEKKDPKPMSCPRVQRHPEAS